MYLLYVELKNLQIQPSDFLIFCMTGPVLVIKSQSTRASSWFLNKRQQRWEGVSVLLRQSAKAMSLTGAEERSWQKDCTTFGKVVWYCWNCCCINCTYWKETVKSGTRGITPKTCSSSGRICVSSCSARACHAAHARFLNCHVQCKFYSHTLRTYQ
jgi:hypothetical protein